jgi:hypothetical protein
MKIRKFNEDITSFSDNEKIIEYVKDCFVEFIDDGANIAYYNDILSISFGMPNVQINDTFSVRYTDDACNDVFDNVREFSDIIEGIRIAIDSIRNRYNTNVLTIEMGIISTGIDIRFLTH